MKLNRTFVSTFTAIVAVMVLCVFSSIQGQTAKVRLAVKAFDNPKTSANSTIGNAVTDIFFTELGRTGRFQLVERAAFDEVAKEIDFGSTDWAKKQSAAGKGGAIGADFILLGTVANFTFQETTVQRNVTTRGATVAQTMYQQIATVRVDFRIVSIRTGEAVVTEFGSDTQSNLSATSQAANFRRIQDTGLSISEAEDSLMGRTTIAAVKNAVRKSSDLAALLTNHLSNADAASRAASAGNSSGRIIGVVGNAYFVDFGTTAVLANSDRLTVIREEVTRNAKGEVLLTEAKEIGTLEVVALDATAKGKARAQLTGGSTSTTQGPREGDMVRIALNGATTAPLAAASSSLPPAGVANTDKGNLQRLTREGDRYLEDRYFAQAISSYEQALALDPSSPDVMDKLATALLYNRQLQEGEDMLNRLLSLRGEVSGGIVHAHALGSCQGVITLSKKDGLSYRPAKGDDEFTAKASDIIGVETGAVRAVPTLTVRLRDSKGKEKKYDFVVPAFLKGPQPIGNISNFTGDAQAVADTTKVHRMLIRMIQATIK